ncbi:MAG: sigma-54 dependent transcriptional regulator [Candidatus Cloacimonadales bacterium]|nr:sigma-54 dependent transcriptional regulator [Candidatus Cloacimonadales bacterium]
MNKILIVDDDKIVVLTLSKLLKKANYATLMTYTGNQAISAMIEFEPDLVLLDFKLPDMNGFEILTKLKDINRKVAVIMITSFGDVRKAVTAIKLGANDFFTKPFDKDEILRVVENIFAARRKQEIHTFNVTEMMGNSEPLQKVLHDIERIYDQNITVFLEGETGTGKELFARMIHNRSSRRQKPFIAVDCGAIPESLFESELFGHTRGAFTGAIGAKKGKFELANGGTLFLDEINSLPMNMQPKFLRALQENEIQKLGDEKPTKIDIRIIAASNNNIYKDVQNGSFREDLFYRIHEFKIDLPTLQQRKDDIMVIAAYFLKEITADYKKDINGFTSAAVEQLEHYSWPGNIRELKNVIKSAVLLSDSSEITKDHLILKNIRKNMDALVDEEDIVIDRFTSKTEEDIIRKALQKTKYNKTEAAKLLGISRSLFYKKLENIEL